MFLDGDAFPIGDIEVLIKERLRAYKLIAVQRLENKGDDQPHPCFCATTVKFWHSIKGDWKGGYRWQNKDGNWVADVGGRLLKQLKDNEIEWYPLLRSNKTNIHPVFFGTYESMIYHHGAGFRDALSRADARDSKTRIRDKLLLLAPRRYRRTRRRKLLNGIVAENDLLSERIFRKIQEDPLFYSEFS
jgi:hypothetical protein